MIFEKIPTIRVFVVLHFEFIFIINSALTFLCLLASEVNDILVCQKKILYHWKRTEYQNILGPYNCAWSAPAWLHEAESVHLTLHSPDAQSAVAHTTNCIRHVRFSSSKQLKSAVHSSVCIKRITEKLASHIGKVTSTPDPEAWDQMVYFKRPCSSGAITAWLLEPMHHTATPRLHLPFKCSSARSCRFLLRCIHIVLQCSFHTRRLSCTTNILHYCIYAYMHIYKLQSYPAQCGTVRPHMGFSERICKTCSFHG